MTLETMSQLGEFVGGFGVIFTLVYLAMQVRNNMKREISGNRSGFAGKKTMDFWFSFPGVKAYWSGRPQSVD